MRSTALLLLCVSASLRLSAQPLPQRAATFRWDAPASLVDAISYELQWGPQDTAQLPLHITEYTVENFPLAFRQTVAVRTMGFNTNSDPVEIAIYNLRATLEESTNGATWEPLQTFALTGERKPSSMLRIKLATTSDPTTP